MLISRCLPGNFWMFRSLMFSLKIHQEKLHNVSTMGAFFSCTGAPRRAETRVNLPSHLIRSVGYFSAISFRFWASWVKDLWVFVLCLLSPEQSLLPAPKVFHMCLWKELGQLCDFEDFSNEGWTHTEKSRWLSTVVNPWSHSEFKSRLYLWSRCHQMNSFSSASVSSCVQWV